MLCECALKELACLRAWCSLPRRLLLHEQPLEDSEWGRRQLEEPRAHLGTLLEREAFAEAFDEAYLEWSGGGGGRGRGG